MTLLTLAAMAALTLTDPTGDALGDGTLAPPTSPVYAHSAIFDIHEVMVTPAAVEGLTESRLAVTMGAVDPDPDTTGGFKGVVVDVYFDVAPGGAQETLVGPGMLMPAGGGWEYAVRLSPAGAIGVRYQGDESEQASGSGAVALAPGGDVVAAVDDAEPAPDGGEDPGAERSGADSAGGADGDLGAGGEADGLGVEPLALTIDGNRLVVTLPWLIDEEAVVYAMSGVYDPFSPTSWRSLSASASPWAYSGGAQVAPVIDVLAVDQVAQTQALTTGVLPRPQRTGDTGTLWLLLMGAGVVLALIGLLLRRRVPAAARPGLPYGLPPEPVAEPGVGRPVAARPEMKTPALGQAEIDQPEGDVPEEDVPEEDAPEGDQPAEDVPDADQPKERDPGVDLPPKDVPDPDLPPDDQPGVDLPSDDRPDVDLPTPEAPGIDLPEVDLPGPDAPGVDLPHPDLPAPGEPDIDLPADDRPDVDLPRPHEPAFGVTGAGEGGRDGDHLPDDDLPDDHLPDDHLPDDDPFDRFVSLDDETEEDETGHVGFGGERR